MKQLHRKDGFVLATIMVTVLFVMTIMIVVVQYAANNYVLSAQQAYRVNAQLAADAGIDIGINELNIDPNWTGSGGEITLLDTDKMRTTYESNLLGGASDNEKVLSVTARVYSPSTAIEPDVVRRYELDLMAVTNSTFGPSSVVSGVGGLVLDNNAKVTGGDVVVNGTIEMGNNSQIGTQSNPVNVRAAHYVCPDPPDATYPQICTSGEPIEIGNNARIYGEVHANNQTTGAHMSNPGLIVGQSVTPTDIPEYDRASQVAAVAVTKNANDSDIRCTNGQTKNWPANVKIVGDVILGNNCKININGNVWITGSFDTGNNGELRVQDSVGTTPPVIMVDGADGFELGNNGEIEPNSSNTGVELRTFWTHASSGCGPDCSGLTGPGLANSQDVVTIDLSNNGNAPFSVFIAQWSRAKVANNGALGAIAGQSIQLGNNAVINFTATVPGSDNLTTTWVKRGYIRVYD